MAHRALTEVMLGHRAPAQPGELIPEHYLDQDGAPQPVDFERLVELGAAEEVKPAKAPAAKPAKE